jgi:hypothetical protein
MLLNDFAPFISYILLLKEFRPYRIIFINMCIVITVATVTLLRDFGAYDLNLCVGWLACR